MNKVSICECTIQTKGAPKVMQRIHCTEILHIFKEKIVCGNIHKGIKE